MKEIKLTKNKIAIVDDDVFDKINAFKWYATERKHTFYAARTSIFNGVKSIIYMHRQILGLIDKNDLADHKDGNGLNNININLRKCDRFENSRNSKGVKNKSSQYKGVHFHNKTNKWRAMIMINRKSKHLGLFENEIEAAKKYDFIAKDNFGEFAKLNFK